MKYRYKSKWQRLLEKLNPEDIDHSPAYSALLTFAYVTGALLVFILTFLYYV